MTVITDRTLWCQAIDKDGHDCPEWYEESGVSLTATDLRRAAKLLGWRRCKWSKRDLCPKHANPVLARDQPCGCVTCICRDDRRCDCGAGHCGRGDCVFVPGSLRKPLNLVSEAQPS